MTYSMYRGGGMNRIKSLRISQTPKMSQEKLGNLVGVGRSAVAMWETDKSEPDNATLSKLAEVFHVSVDYLLGRTDLKEMPAPKDEDGQKREELDQEFMRWFQQQPPARQKEVLFDLARTVAGHDE